MLETLLSVGSGGLFGLIGAGVTKFMAYKDKKLTFEHEKVMASEDRQTMAAETERARIQGTIDLELQESESDAANLQAATNAKGTVTKTSPWVADLRASVRPILTYLLVFFAVAMSVWASETNPHTKQVIFLAATAVTFWFGSRPPSTK